MAHIYRCSKCRTRNTFHRAVGSYVRAKTCRTCGHAKFYVDKERVHREACRCSSAYFWGPHRKGSAFCEHNPDVDVHRARRDGLTAGEIAWLGLGLKLHTGTDIPF